MSSQPSTKPTDRYKNPDNDPRGPYILADVTSPPGRPRQVYEWRGRVPPSGRSWRYSLERAQALEAEGRIVFPSIGSPRLKRYLDEVQGLEPPPRTLVAPPKRLELILRPAMQQIARAVAEDPACLQYMEWRDLERVLREVFERMGFDTELTRSSKDGGFDLRLESGSEDKSIVFLVEVKHWVNSNKRPGNKEVEAFFDVVVSSSEASSGLLLSSNGFTRGALRGRTEIQQQVIRLGGEEKLISLCQDYLQSESGFWAPTTDLSAVLVQRTY